MIVGLNRLTLLKTIFYSEMSVDPDLCTDEVFFLFSTIGERARTNLTLVFLF